MRIFLFSAVALLTVGLLGTGPAKAAWTCVGADFVCGGVSGPSARPHRAARTFTGEARRARSLSGRYHGPTRKSASRRGVKRAIAADRAPRARRAARAYTGGSGQTGIASYYWQGQRVASGGRFNPNALTAAHRSLPFGTRVRVTSLGSGRSVTVTINDRGPFVRGRVIDLSRAAAGVIGMRGAGLARVRLDVVGRN